jgi:hypothetical protein
MNDQEREAARLGMSALDAALVALDQRPVAQNPDFRFAEPVIGDIPHIVLEKAGVAPVQFIFGRDLDIWVGPFSEVVLVTVTLASLDLIQQRLQQILQSSVAYETRKRSMVLTLQLADAKPWLRLTSYGRPDSPSLEPYYGSYV